MVKAALRRRIVGRAESLHSERLFLHRGAENSRRLGGRCTYRLWISGLSTTPSIGHSADHYPVAVESAREIISPPMYPRLREDQIEYVAEQIALFMRQGA
jgi:dTDP-4-amino-4,6-dideoxygalactose transaminase